MKNLHLRRDISYDVNDDDDDPSPVLFDSQGNPRCAPGCIMCTDCPGKYWLNVIALLPNYDFSSRNKMCWSDCCKG